MKTWLIHIWSRMRTSFWFVPSAMVLACAAVAYGTLWIDRQSLSDGLPSWITPGTASAEGLRSLLATTATAVLTLAGLTFSATLVALTLASSQFGSRILRNFIRSMPNQFALGTLLGNFVFCLLVLRSVRSIDEGAFIPHIAAFTAFVTTLASLATFIYFIHHISVSLQADHIVAAVHDELDDTLERFFPNRRPADPDEREANDEKAEWEEIEDEIPIRARRSGYIQAINVEGLVETCTHRNLRCRLLYRPGQFVHAGETLIAVDKSSASENGDDLSGLADDVIIGRIRTAEQDFEFCLRQLVEIALRALSPGINDPFTALNCIDYLGAALGKVATRHLPRRTFSDRDKTPRVRVRPTAFADLLGAAFHQLRQTAACRPDVAIRLLDTLAEIGERAMIDSHREAIAIHADAVVAESNAQVDCDREAIREAHQRVLDALGEETTASDPA